MRGIFVFGSATMQSFGPKSALLLFHLVLGAFVALGVLSSCAQRPPEPEGLALIPGGTFLLGNPDEEMGRILQEPLREVTLDSFWLQQTPVTHAQWTEIRDWALRNGYPDLPPGAKGSHNDDRNRPLDPVTKVSWYDAAKWLNAWSEREGLRPVYRLDGKIFRAGEGNIQMDPESNGYRLPTEAEWERAAREGLSLDHALSPTWEDDLQKHAWFAVNSDTGRGPQSHPVATRAPNPLGLYDMLGNVDEWCWDWHGPAYPETRTNPTGLAAGSTRVTRGGNWNTAAPFCRPAYRSGASPQNGHPSIGFRAARGGGM
jgi:sulfatase modifying factor 1